MGEAYKPIKLGLALVLLGLLFGIGLGISFGVREEAFEDYIAEGIAAHPEVHDAKSADKIWRYAQRAHFHATGIAAFSIGLLLLLAGSNMVAWLKQHGNDAEARDLLCESYYRPGELALQAQDWDDALPPRCEGR